MTDEDFAIPPEALGALERGHKIEAIKIIRERTGLGLAEAKQLAERHERQVPPPARGSCAVGPVTGCSRCVWGALAAALLVGYLIGAFVK